MRTLEEIVTTAKDGEMPSHEECYWAMLAFDALHTLDHYAVLDLANTEMSAKSRRGAGESFRRSKIALQVSPRDWMGWNNDPSNPQYQKRRKISLVVFDKVLGDSA